MSYPLRNICKPFIIAALFAGTLAWLPRAEAGPVPCILCGSTALAAPGVDGTVSFAVITGASFTAEVAAHAIGFFGLVPPGTLGPPALPAPTDFVYLYQLVNGGIGPVNVDFISGWTISGGGIGGAITAGTRLESTLFVDPNVGPPALITAGPVAAPTAVGLSAGPMVNFENGLGAPVLGDPVFPPWGPCLGSGGVGVNCSDGSADLFATFISVFGWTEAPSAGLLDPFWSGSVIWIASPIGPVTGTTSITAGMAVAMAEVPVPGVPAPAPLALMGLGLVGMAFARRRRAAA